MKNTLLILVLLLLSGWAAAAGHPAPFTATERDWLSLQICLDRRRFSPNTLDGQNGRKTQVALLTWCAARGIPCPVGLPPARIRGLLFPNEPPLFTTVRVTAADHAALTPLPREPEAKAALAAMGFQTIQEMYAERGHLSETALKRLNPHAAWPNPPAGTVLEIPLFRPLPKKSAPDAPVADTVRVSLSRREITAFDRAGRLLALIPCSIAADKSKRPPAGELHVQTLIENPNYTYTPEPPRKAARKLIFPPGPNNPVGAAWIGLSLPTYGIHGTPTPERIGNAESHGCFRTANWNARLLFSLCTLSTSITVEP